MGRPERQPIARCFKPGGSLTTAMGQSKKGVHLELLC